MAVEAIYGYTGDDWGLPKLDKKQRRDLFYEDNVPGFELIGEQFLYMDSHGMNITLVIFKMNGDHRLFGYLCEVHSESTQFDMEEVFEVKPKEVTTIQYVREDGKKWRP